MSTLLALSALLSVAQAAPLTMAEVARHDSAEDCWLVLDGSVYDVTEFIASHPGGDQILRGCGKDATWFFNNRPEAGPHTAGATTLAETYRLGALGDEHTPGEAPPTAHPHDTRAQGMRGGLLTTTDVAPARSINLHVQHQITTSDLEPARVEFQIGVGIGGFMDLYVSDVQGDGVSGLDARFRVLDQHGARGMPLSAALKVGGGYSPALEAPALHGQLILERDLLDRRLDLRAAATGAMFPGLDGAGGMSVGGGLEFRPIPIHGLFGEIIVPVVGEGGELAWSAGARIYTRGHHFSLYVASTPNLATGLMHQPSGEGLSIGFGIDRAFVLAPRRKK